MAFVHLLLVNVMFVAAKAARQSTTPVLARISKASWSVPALDLHLTVTRSTDYVQPVDLSLLERCALVLVSIHIRPQAGVVIDACVFLLLGTIYRYAREHFFCFHVRHCIIVSYQYTRVHYFLCS